MPESGNNHIKCPLKKHFETGFCSIDQTNSTLMIFIPDPPNFWDFGVTGMFHILSSVSNHCVKCGIINF